MTSDDELLAIQANIERTRFNLESVRIRDDVNGIWYSRSPSAKDFDTVVTAMKTAEWAAKDLGIQTPEVKWFLESDSELFEPSLVQRFGKAFHRGPGLVGAVDVGNVIWLHAGLTPRQAVDVAAHECKHLASGGDEDAAFDYGKLAQLRLWGPLEAVGGSAAVWLTQGREVIREKTSGF